MAIMKRLYVSDDTHFKIKALALMDQKSLMDFVEWLVDQEYTRRVEQPLIERGASDPKDTAQQS